MKTGVIGAMEEEIAALREKMQVGKPVKKALMEFFAGTLHGRDIIVVRSGIGKVNAAVCAQILADTFHVDRIINTGIAGALKDEIEIGDIVISTDALQHDVDVREFGYQPGQVPRIDTLAFPADKALGILAEEVCKAVNPAIQVFRGRVVSGDQFIAGGEAKKRITENFGGLCVEMEGAAIAQAAYLNGIPYVIIRAISDRADGSAAADYPAFQETAIAGCVRLTEHMILRG